MQQVVTFTEIVHNGTPGVNERGPYHFRVFKTTGGTRFQTFEVPIGDTILASFGQPLDVEYGVKDSTKDGKTYQNNIIKSVKQVATSPDHYAGQTDAKPSLTDALPKSYEDERQLRIMRQSALDRAINTVGHGIVQADDVSDLFKLADTYILYFEAGISAFTPEEVVTY